ncbi:hypothetical protein [Burkholderia multivorans]|uniref:hypothetical protein n=1 Tax=Burkholderia multivorans TaxID=87883 RepID=UPI0021BE1BDC|nr:hypothetical protein [Burkholderia multivorans]
MASQHDTNQAVELVKEALGAGLLEPGSPSGYLGDPEKNGEALGKFIAAAVKAAAEGLAKI